MGTVFRIRALSQSEADDPTTFASPSPSSSLPPIIFISSFFSVLYYFGVLQLFVRLMARVMMYLMGTSGAETLSVSANVFMGQTEAPLIVKPFVPKMTRSELLALMGSGMAHVSGGMMAVYISYSGFGTIPPRSARSSSPVVMACPCSLYLTKLLLARNRKAGDRPTRRNVVESRTSTPSTRWPPASPTGSALALNVAAMLIGFIAFIALFNAMVGGIKPLLLEAGIDAATLSSEMWLLDRDRNDPTLPGRITIAMRIADVSHLPAELVTR